MINEENKWNTIVNKLKMNNLTLSTMESCTGGGIANEITNISGASSVLKESYITYCNEAKIKLGVKEEIIAKYTVYSSETAIEMAKVVKQKANSNIGIGVTGQLGRIDSNNPVDNINCVWFATIDESNKIVVKKINVPDTDRRNQKQFVLNEVAATILELIENKGEN